MPKSEYFYKRHNLKHATGFLTPEDIEKLRLLAKADDKSLTLYVTRLLEKHIQEKEKSGELKRAIADLKHHHG